MLTHHKVLIFTLIMYFMCNLDLTASKYFIYVLFVYVTTINVTALYRMSAYPCPLMYDLFLTFR